MKKKLYFLFLLILVFATNNLQAQPLAFPGADGHGKYTTGGRGGAVYTVTKLTDDGSVGTLRWAINQSGARTIVFAVSGTIYLTSKLSIANGNVTIAGQTAPAPGICISDYQTSINADNVIIRYLRFRLGSKYMNEDDAFNGTDHANIIIDHCSMSWSIDECASFYGNQNFTMQWCILAESLWDSGHPKGQHGYGGIWGGLKASFHHNLLSCHTSRNPRFCGARYHDTTPETEIVDFRNNVIFNWGFNSSYGGEIGQQNMVNNYYKSGPATSSGVRNRIVDLNKGTYANAGTWYIAGNYVNGYPTISADNWAGGVQGSDAGSPGVRATVPFDDGGIATETAQEAYASVLAKVGAKLPLRDAFDQRIVNEVHSGSCTYYETYPRTATNGKTTIPYSGIINNESAVGGVPALEENVGPADTDLDGMPDAWETANGLNPSNASDRNNLNPDGYTMLELFMSDVIQDITGDTLTVNDGGHGTVTLNPAGGIYIPGTSVDITVVPKIGYAFTGWTGDLVSSQANITVTMDSSINLTANYEIVAINQYSLNTTVIGNGSITLNPSGGIYNEGSTVNVTALANIGNYFDGWTGDLSAKGSKQNILMNANKSITANFIPSTITGKKIAYVTDPAGTFYGNDTKILTALKADPNFIVTEIDANNTGVNYSLYDLIIISEVPASGALGMPALEGINKPVIMMKVHAYKSTVWAWSNTDTDFNQNATETNIIVSDLSHPMFRNLNFVNSNEVKVLNSVVGSKGLTFMTPTAFKTLVGSVTALATIKNNATQASIIQIPAGTSINGTTIPQTFIQIGINSNSYAQISDDGVKMVLNACYYQLGESFNSTQIQEIQKNKIFSCKPTLVDNVITIYYTGKEKASVSISNLMGQQIITKDLKTNPDYFDLSILPAGVYICTLETESQKQSIKLIKK